MKHKILCLFFLLLLISPAFAWWDNSWEYRLKITAENYSGNEAIFGLPLLIDGNSNNLSFTNIQADCDDIRFVDMDDTTELDFEWIEKDCSDNNFLAYVQSIKINSNTDYIYLYYGNVGASDGSDKNGTWDGNYLMVWHNENSTSEFLDSTNNNYWGLGTGGEIIYQTQGKIGYAASFPLGDGKTIPIQSGGLPDFNKDFTILYWIKINSESTIEFLDAGGLGNPNEWHLYQGNNYQFSGQDADGTTVNPYGWERRYQDGIWHLFGLKNDNATRTMTIGIDGNWSTEATMSVTYAVDTNWNGIDIIGNLQDLNFDETFVLDKNVGWSEFTAIYQQGQRSFSSFGSEENLSETIGSDINIVIPNGGENWTPDINRLIVFTIQDSDDNYLTARLYYSTSPLGFTNHIVDLNLLWIAQNPTADANCQDTAFYDDTNCFYDWNVSGIAYGTNYYLDINMFDSAVNDNTDSSDSQFTIGFPTATVTSSFSFTAPTAIDNELSIFTTVDLNDTSTITDGNATTWKWFNGGTSFHTDQNISVEFKSSGDHNICLNITVQDGSDINYSDINCNTITIQEYPQNLEFTNTLHEPDLSSFNFDFNGTADNDTNITSWVWDFNDGTHMEGQDLNYTFATSGDFNVCLTATTPTDLNKIACNTVSPYTLTVKIPLNEKDFAEITPFTVRIESTTSVQDLNAQNADAVFHISATETYRIKVYDTNGIFYPRTYYVSITEGTGSYTIQPYLTDELYTLIYVFDNYSKMPLNDVKIQIKKIISGTNTIIQEMRTDGTGTAGVSFIINDQYTAEFYIGDTLKYSMTLFPSSADAIYVYLDLNQFVPITEYHPTDIQIAWQPPEGRVAVPDTNILDFNQTITIAYGTIQEIQIIMVNDGNTVYDSNFTVGVGAGGLFTQQFDLNSFNTGYPVYCTIIIRTTDGNFFVFNTAYVIKPASVWGDFFSALEDIGNEFGPTFTNLAAIFITLFICGAAMKVATVNVKGISIMAGVMLGIFVFLGWLNFYLFALMAMGILAMWLFEG